MPPLDGWTYPTLTRREDEPAATPPAAPGGWTYPTLTQPAPASTPAPMPTPVQPETPPAAMPTPQPPEAASAPMPTPAPVDVGLTDPGGVYGDPDMPGAVPPPDPNDHRRGVADSVVDALVDSMREGRQLATGNALDPNQNIPAPVERTTAGGMAYGLAHSAPTLASMVGGGWIGAEAGTAVAPGPGTAIGAAGGAALGGGLMDFAQSLTPAYVAARQRGLDHQQAVDEAYNVAASSGALTGVTAPLFGLKVFKAPISNLLFHAFGTGPAVGAVHRGVITPAVTGQPAPTGEQMLEGYLQDVAGGTATMGAMHAGPAIARAFRPDTRPTLDIGTPQTPPGQPTLPGPRAPTPFSDILRPDDQTAAPHPHRPPPTNRQEHPSQMPSQMHRQNQPPSLQSQARSLSGLVPPLSPNHPPSAPPARSSVQWLPEPIQLELFPWHRARSPWSQNPSRDNHAPQAG